MKKFRLIATILIIAMSITGCQIKKENSSKEVISNIFIKAVEEGKLAIADNDYVKAYNMFTLALEEHNDDEISKLNEQCKLVIELIEISDELENEKDMTSENVENKINSIYELCEKIVNIDTKSNLIKDKVKELKMEIASVKKEIEDPKKEDKKEIQSSKNTKENIKRTLCSCGKNYIEDNKQWKGEDKCDTCINEIVNSHADNYACAVCGNKTNTLCQFDECYPLCEDDMGYYCECGEYHHTQELCPVFDI